MKGCAVDAILAEVSLAIAWSPGMGNDAMRRLISCLLTPAALALGAASAKAVDITECGQVVPERQVANQYRHPERILGCLAPRGYLRL